VRKFKRPEHLIVAAQIADRLGVKRPASGFRVFGDDNEAGFFLGTEFGNAKVTIEVMQGQDSDLSRRWEIGDDNEPRRTRRDPLYP
jgi:hypothetical protein